MCAAVLIVQALVAPMEAPLVLQETLGALACVLQWQRPSSSCLLLVFRSLKAGAPRALGDECVDELLLVAGYLPACVANLTAQSDPEPLALDASETGGVFVSGMRSRNTDKLALRTSARAADRSCSPF